MEHLPEFLGNHWILSSSFIVVLVLLIANLRSSTLNAGMTPRQAVKCINDQGAVVFDIRPEAEWKRGHIVNATHVPHADLAARLPELMRHKSTPVIVVCNAGMTSAQACKTLREAGFKNVVQLSGGIAAWRQDNLPLTT